MISYNAVKIHDFKFVTKFSFFFEKTKLRAQEKNIAPPLGDHKKGVRALVPSDPMLRCFCT
jgi:hypothetical protein